MRILSYGERIEKVRNHVDNPHILNEQGVTNLKEKFEDKETDFGAFVQFIFASAFKEGMLEAIRLLEDPYDR